MINKILIVVLFLSTLSMQSDAQVSVDFNASITRSCVSTQVVFTNLSTSTAGTIVDLEWDLAGIFAAPDYRSRVRNSDIYRHEQHLDNQRANKNDISRLPKIPPSISGKKMKPATIYSSE